jgi:hypothetical protein
MNYTLKEHFTHYSEDTTRYVEDITKLYSDKILCKSAPINTKAYILMVLLHYKNKETFKSLYEYIDLPELTKACELMDTGRYKRQLAKKLEKWPNSKKIHQEYKQLIIDTNHDMEEYKISFNLSHIKIIKGWVKQLSADKLIYRAMMFSTDLWKKLADLCHLHPTKDFALDWFLPFCFGSPVPENNIVHAYHNLTYENFIEYYRIHNFDYETIRIKLSMNVYNIYIADIKRVIVSREKLNTILWYWDELVNADTISIVMNRLKNTSEQIDLSYGKIVDLISKTHDSNVCNDLIKLAEEKLTNYKININQPIAIFGDKSSSMQVAIKISAIITSLLCYICDAHLHLFNDVDNHIINPPKTIADAIRFGKECNKAQGTTAPAASLYHYYKNKTPVKTIILITDEEENTKCNEYKFATLYAAYRQEVYPAKLVFISFTDPNTDAFMVRDLKMVLGDDICNEYIKVFKFNVKNPDLNRMDVVLKYLAGDF